MRKSGKEEMDRKIERDMDNVERKRGIVNRL